MPRVYDDRYDPFGDQDDDVAISNESHTVPSASPYYIQLAEVPSTTAITISGYTQVFSAAPSASEFQADHKYKTGLIRFNASDAGNAVQVTYQGGGSPLIASDVNALFYRKLNEGFLIGPQRFVEWGDHFTGAPGRLEGSTLVLDPRRWEAWTNSTRAQNSDASATIIPNTYGHCLVLRGYAEFDQTIAITPVVNASIYDNAEAIGRFYFAGDEVSHPFKLQQRVLAYGIDGGQFGVDPSYLNPISSPSGASFDWGFRTGIGTWNGVTTVMSSYCEGAYWTAGETPSTYSFYCSPLNTYYVQNAAVNSLSQFHTLTIDWTPGLLGLYIDGVSVGSASTFLGSGQTGKFFGYIYGMKKPTQERVYHYYLLQDYVFGTYLGTV